MIFEQFAQRSISHWKQRRDELAVHVQEAEHTGDGVEVASAAIAEQLVRCECAEKKLRANLGKLHEVAQGLILNQPSIPPVCGISAMEKNSLSIEEFVPSSDGLDEPEEIVEFDCNTLTNPVALAYAIAELARRDEVDEGPKNRLRGIIQGRAQTSLEDICVVWVVLACMLGARRPHDGYAAAQVYFNLIRSKRQPSEILASIFHELAATESLGLKKLQLEAESAYGVLAESSAANKWLAIFLSNDLLRMYILGRLELASSRFREVDPDASDANELSSLCATWLEETTANLTEKTMFRPSRQDLVTLLLQFLVKLEIPALPLYRCASRCLSKDQILSPTLISTCAESLAGFVSKGATSCQSVTELYSLFLRRFCTFAVECDDPEWLLLISAGIAVFYSKLTAMFLPDRLNLAIYGAAFVNVALESLPIEIREHVQALRPICDALRALGQAAPAGFQDKREEVASKLMSMCAVCSRILGKSIDVVKKEGVMQQTMKPPSVGRPVLPEIVVNRSILDLAQGEASATSSTLTEHEVAASPALATRFSFDNLLGGAGGSRETAVAAFVGKWTAWGRRT